MALLLSTELDSGITGNYWRIGSVVVACVANPIVTVYMELYFNRTAKYNNKTPLKTIPINMNLSDIDPTFDFDFRACVYNAMSNLQGWTDAKYLYEFDETYEQIPIVNYLEVESDFNGSIQLPAFQGQDLNNLPLSYEIVDQPSNGLIEENNGVYTYTPNSNWFGDEIATYRCFNGSEYSKPAKIFLTVESDLPTANDVSLECDYNGSAIITFSASDPNNLPLTFEVLSQPTNGTVVEDNGVFTYNPNEDWFGSDSAIYIAKNGTYDSNVANITFIVESDVPTVLEYDLTGTFNSTNTFVLTGTDPHNLPLTFEIIEQPVNGTISFDNGQFVFTPNSNWVGTDTAKYRASNGTYESATVDINIIVDYPVPIVNSSNITLNQNESTSFELNGSDLVNLPLTFTVIELPSNGTLTLVSGNSYTYTPNQDFIGQDMISFKASNGYKDSELANIRFEVQEIV